jgi:hypothetical protein
MARVSTATLKENRRNALRFHRRRYAGLLFWPLLVIAVVFMPTFAAAGSSPAASIAAATTNMLLRISPLAPMLAIPALQFGIALFLAFYMFALDVRWERERFAATQSIPETSARSYLDANQTMIGANYVAVVVGMFGVLTVLAVLSPAQLSHWPAWVQAAFGVGLCWLGYRLERRYVCGSVFAQQMMALTEMTGPERISRTAAMDRISGTREKMKAERPECFYHTARRQRR